MQLYRGQEEASVAQQEPVSPKASKAPVYMFVGVLVLGLLAFAVSGSKQIASQNDAKNQISTFEATFVLKDGSSVKLDIRSKTRDSAVMLAGRIQNWIDTSSVAVTNGTPIPDGVRTVLSPAPEWVKRVDPK